MIWISSRHAGSNIVHKGQQKNFNLCRLTAPQRAEEDVFGISKDRFKDVEPIQILDAKQN